MAFIFFKNKKLSKAEHALNDCKYKKAYTIGLALVHAKNKEIAFRANRVCGLALYKQKKYDDSLTFLESACQKGNYRHDWYNLAMAFTFNGMLENAEEAFKNIYRTGVQPGFMYAVPVPGLLYQYIKALKKNEFPKTARARANELKQMFIGVGSDTTKQVQRGLPSFDVFLSEVEALFQPEEFSIWKNLK